MMISICLSKYVFSMNKLTVWEDIYGRSFVGAFLSYILVLYNRAGLCDSIPSEIRLKVFFAQIMFVVAFALVTISINHLSVFAVAAILLNFNAYSQKVFLIFSVAGLVILANPMNVLVDGVNTMVPII